MAGHCHPAVMKAVSKRLTTGTMFGMPHDMEWQLAEEICNRFPVEMVRFGISRNRSHHACRPSGTRRHRPRQRSLRFEGGYHGLHDAALVSVKPHAPEFGDLNAPTSVPGGLGVPKASMTKYSVAAFNDLARVELRFKQNPGEIAAIILEPIMMNVGLCMPQTGFLEGLREIATKNGALTDLRRSEDRREARMGRSLGIFRREARHGVSRQVNWRRLAAGRLRPHKSVMDLISQHKVFHGGTYNTNPVSMAAGLATFREVLTRENYAHVEKLSQKLNARISQDHRESLACRLTWSARAPMAP